MAIELPKASRPEALASLARYFQEHLEERMGHIAASALPGFFREEVGPAIDNQAAAGVQECLSAASGLPPPRFERSGRGDFKQGVIPRGRERLR
ncbi:MAG: DUF2164 family protein [Burkholderiaceae bacterium]|nr:DUF2164 family protein [Burkholderiaceae bacterium]